MTKGGRNVGRFESQERKKKVPLDVLLHIEPFNDFFKRLKRVEVKRKTGATPQSFLAPVFPHQVE
jgi:hypothetical protein